MDPRPKQEEQSRPSQIQHRAEGLGGPTAVRGAVSLAKGVRLFPLVDKDTEKAGILTGLPK